MVLGKRPAGEPFKGGSAVLRLEAIAIALFFVGLGVGVDAESCRSAACAPCVSSVGSTVGRCGC